MGNKLRLALCLIVCIIGISHTNMIIVKAAVAPEDRYLTDPIITLFKNGAGKRFLSNNLELSCYPKEYIPSVYNHTGYLLDVDWNKIDYSQTVKSAGFVAYQDYVPQIYDPQTDQLIPMTRTGEAVGYDFILFQRFVDGYWQNCVVDYTKAIPASEINQGIYNGTTTFYDGNENLYMLMYGEVSYNPAYNDETGLNYMYPSATARWFKYNIQSKTWIKLEGKPDMSGAIPWYAQNGEVLQIGKITKYGDVIGWYNLITKNFSPITYKDYPYFSGVAPIGIGNYMVTDGIYVYHYNQNNPVTSTQVYDVNYNFRWVSGARENIFMGQDSRGKVTAHKDIAGWIKNIVSGTILFSWTSYGEVVKDGYAPPITTTMGSGGPKGMLTVNDNNVYFLLEGTLYKRSSSTNVPAIESNITNVFYRNPDDYIFYTKKDASTGDKYKTFKRSLNTEVVSEIKTPAAPKYIDNKLKDVYGPIGYTDPDTGQYSTYIGYTGTEYVPAHWVSSDQSLYILESPFVGYNFIRTVNSPPSLSLSASNDWTWAGNGTLTISGTVNDSDAGDSETIRCTIAGVTQTTVVTPGSYWELNFNIPALGIPEGTHDNIVVTASDGKVTTSAVYANHLNVDRTPPSVPSINLSNYSWTRDNVAFTLGDSWDSFVGLMKRQYSIGGGDWIDYNGGTITVGNEGATLIQSRAIDWLGNVSSNGSIYTYIDRTIPSAPAIYPSTESWTSNNVTFNLDHGSDSLGAVWKSQYRINYGGWVDYYGTVTLENQGEYQIDAKTLDYAGNESSYATKYVHIDKTYPAGVGILSTTGWTNQDVTITFNASDSGGSGVKGITKPDNTWVTTSNTSYIASSNGTYNVIVEDNAGNKSTIAVPVTKIDKTPPTAAWVTNSGTPTVLDSFDVFANNVADNASGITSVKYKVWTSKNGEDDVRWYTAANTDSTNWKYTINRVNHNNEPGLYIVEVYAYDGAGNSAKVGTTNVLLNKLPTVNINSPTTRDFKVGNPPVFNVTVGDPDGDTIAAGLQKYNGVTWDTLDTKTGLTNGQVTTLSMDTAYWQSLPYDTDYRFRVVVTDSNMGITSSSEKVIRKVNTAPTLNNLKPAESQYVLSGYQKFSWDAVDPDNHGLDVLHLKIYTDSPNVVNNGVFYDGNINKGVDSYTTFTYLQKGDHNIIFEIKDSQTTTTIVRHIKVPEELNLSTGNEDETFYLADFDLEKNDMYYKRINNQLRDNISIINILGGNGNLNEAYLTNITGMQNVTGDSNYTDNGRRIYAKDGIYSDRIKAWIAGVLGQNPDINQVLEVGAQLKLKNILYADYEKDAEKNRRFRFFHIPGSYDNPQGEILDNGVWTMDSSFTSFDGTPVTRSGDDISIVMNRAGKYIIDLQTDDDIRNPRGIDFSKSSNLKDYVVYVHRRPKAVISYTEIAPFTIKLDSLQSYDPDFYSRSDKGIKSVTWEYRLIDYNDNIFQDWQPISDINSFAINPIYKTDIRLKVTDYGALIDESGDGEFSDTDILTLDDTGRPPIANFEYRVGTSFASSGPSWDIVYKGQDGHETVWYDDSSIIWNDLLSPSGTRSREWQYDETAFNFFAGSSSMTDSKVELYNALTVTNKYNLRDLISKKLTVKRVEMSNNTASKMDAQTGQKFQVALSSIDGVLQWSDIDVKISSADLGLSDVQLYNTASNIFERDIYVPETSKDDCKYTVKLYSRRTGELLLSKEFPVTVTNIYAYDFTVTSILDIAWRSYYFDLSSGIDDDGDGITDRYPKKSNTEIKTPVMPINPLGLINHTAASIKAGYKVKGYIRVYGNPATVTLTAKYIDDSGVACSEPIPTINILGDRYDYEWIIPGNVQSGTYIYFDLSMIKGTSFYGNERWRDNWNAANSDRFVFYIDGKAIDDMRYNQSH